ncbi:MAG: histidine phosphatase family protein [Candidatus Latescibacteria bacterium]|jgi:broad specificity phosphatase PhoE|nr:histidine phosphatase family protein [Candidatus Latescibacterota bacterium]
MEGNLMPKRLYLIRHGRTAWNTEQKWQGLSDTPLDGVGREQAKRLAHRMTQLPLDILYSSDLSRALDTAQAVADAVECEVIPTPSLKERSYGEWEGLTSVEVEQRWPDDLFAYRDNSASAIPTGGESWDMFALSRVEAIESIAKKHRDQSVGIVSHAGPTIAFINHVLGLVRDQRSHIRVDNVSITTIEPHSRHGGQPYWRLVGLNDVVHLEDTVPRA